VWSGNINFSVFDTHLLIYFLCKTPLVFFAACAYRIDSIVKLTANSSYAAFDEILFLSAHFASENSLICLKHARINPIDLHSRKAKLQVHATWPECEATRTKRSDWTHYEYQSSLFSANSGLFRLFITVSVSFLCVCFPEASSQWDAMRNFKQMKRESLLLERDVQRIHRHILINIYIYICIYIFVCDH
jgi:hypothetical protein